MKQCFKCEEVKPLSEFYKHKAMKDGYLNKCKVCARHDVRKHRSENDHVREYDRARYHENEQRRARTHMTTVMWQRRNPLQYKANYIVGNAIRDKKLFKKPCEICGDINVHAHHDDYTKPLDVRWLCPRHHHQTHALDKMILD